MTISTVMEKGTAIAMVAGPSEVLEAMRQTAIKTCAIPIDWGYIAGRGIFRAMGTPEEIETARRALQATFPQCMIYTKDGELTSDPI